MNYYCKIFVGLQASGKTTFYRKYFLDDYLYLSLDMLNTRNRESILLSACVNSKTNFIIDNTNPMIKDRKRYISKIRRHRYKYYIDCYYFNSILEECIERNKNRGRIPEVPEIALRYTNKHLQVPTYDEGFDRIFDISIINNEFISNERRR
jgi:predicted kinase